jgi:hypothetical protein
MQSGADLSGAKKKYRRMRCLDCAAYNAATPWAALWPRKFELQTLVDHSQSSHHMKSEAARRKLGLPSGHAQDAEGEEAAEDAEGAEKTEGGEGPEDTFVTVEGSSSIEAASTSASSSASGSGSGSTRVAKKWPQAVSAAAMDAHGRLYGTKGHARPDWLHYEGQLCYSDKQQLDAGLQPGTKKKYRKVQCVYCLEFLSESPWSVLKPRKFESAVLGELQPQMRPRLKPLRWSAHAQRKVVGNFLWFRPFSLFLITFVCSLYLSGLRAPTTTATPACAADHERSGYHQKALELRAAHMAVVTVSAGIVPGGTEDPVMMAKFTAEASEA